MSVTREDIQHIAALARLGIDDAGASTLASELTTILRHMEVLSGIETDGIDPDTREHVAALPMRPDHGPPIPMIRVPVEFAPRMQDGFFLVPRLATHEDQEGS